MKLLLPSLVLCAGGTVAALTDGPAPHPSSDRFDAVILPVRVVQLGAATDGLLAEVDVDRGDVVEAGQVVARLDVTVEEANASLARARSRRHASREMIETRLADAQRRLVHQESLLSDGYLTPEEVATLRTEVEPEKRAPAEHDEDLAIADLERKRAEALLAQGTITSPIDGVVIERHLSPGEILSRSGQPVVLTIAQLDPLLVEVHLPVELYAEVEVGDVGTILPDVPNAAPRPAKIIVKDRLIDTASHTFRVRLELPNPGSELPSGVRCRVELRG